MKQTKQWIAVAVACLAMTGCIDIPQEKKTSFETLEIKTQDLEVPVKYSCTMEGQKEVTITPQTSGNITAVLVQLGQHVRKGQPLFRIDPRQAQATVDNAAANVQAAKASLNTAELEMNSKKNLFDKNIVSSYVYEAARNAYNQAKANVAQAEAALNHARLELSYCTVTSPINGIVGSRTVELGELVQPGMEMARVSEASTIKAKFSASEDLFIEVKTEAERLGSTMSEELKKMNDVSLELKNGTVYQHKGRIVRWSGVIDTQTGTVEVQAEFPNPEGTLTSGNMGKVVYPYQVKDVIVIPTSAIVRQLDKTIVWKVEADSCAHSTSVKTHDLGQQVVVLEGLKVGDKIVANGASNVTDGQKVIY